MKLIDDFPRLINFPALAELHSGGADVFPFGAERFNNRRHHKAFNIGARREMRAQLMPLAFTAQRAFQQRAENGRFNVLPVEGRRRFQNAKLRAVHPCCRAGAAPFLKTPSCVPSPGSTVLSAKPPPLNLSSLRRRMREISS